MVPDDLHDFFVAAAGVAGALVGLLFVAISVSSSRLSAKETSAPIHRIRAAAALTAFTNALTVSLFALIPGEKVGSTSIVVACIGLGFIAASLLSLIRLHLLLSRRAREAVFLLGLIIMFTFQLIEGLRVNADPTNEDPVRTIAVLVVVCFLLGISRAWELIGGPSFGVTHEVTALIHKPHDETPAPDNEDAGAAAPRDRQDTP
jgi:hypothetical protein